MEGTHLEATLIVGVPVALVCTALRAALSASVQYCKKHASLKNSRFLRESVVEEFWLFASSCCLLALSTWATANHNAGCKPLGSTAACFDKWPYQEDMREVKNALAVFLGWYIHSLLKNLVPAIGGVHAGADMVGHHFVTLGLMAVQHIFTVQRAALLILALLNFSSPFMHLAKIAHNLGGLPKVKAGLFVLFTAVFAASRCVEFPRLILTIMSMAWERISEGGILLPAIVCFSGLGVLQALQFYWLGKMIKIIMRGGMEPSKSAAKEEEASTSKTHPQSNNSSGVLHKPHAVLNTPSATLSDDMANTLDAPLPLDSSAQFHSHCNSIGDKESPSEASCRSGVEFDNSQQQPQQPTAATNSLLPDNSAIRRRRAESETVF